MDMIRADLTTVFAKAGHEKVEVDLVREADVHLDLAALDGDLVADAVELEALLAQRDLDLLGIGRQRMVIEQHGHGDASE